MTNLTSLRKTRYVGCFGYNDSPDELGEPAGVWQFPNYDAMWATFEISESLNRAFDTLGEPTYSAILLAIDTEGYLLFHLLVVSAKRIYPRELEVIEGAKARLLEQGIVWNVPESENGQVTLEDIPF
jgi:hypothetical protein